ncbi:MAG: hypothetical protein WAV54_17770 [Acidimicrobiales bacterium]
MAFRAEKRLLKHALSPGENILASDILGGIRELPKLSEPAVIVVTDMGMHLILSGRESEVRSISFDELAGVARKTTPSGRELQLIFGDGDASTALTCVFHPRDRKELTGDLITRRFFGHVVKDTTVEFPDSGGGVPR